MNNPKKEPQSGEMLVEIHAKEKKRAPAVRNIGSISAVKQGMRVLW